MRTRLRLFLDWGITFGEAYQTPDHGKRKVYYADRRELETAIRKKYPPSGADAVPLGVSQTAAVSRNKQPFRRKDEDPSSVRA